MPGSLFFVLAAQAVGLALVAVAAAVIGGSPLASDLRLGVAAGAVGGLSLAA